jgi:hypothetical protein
MATLNSTNPTLADLAKRIDPDGKVPVIVELLNTTNEILTDMTFQEGNLPIGDRLTMRTGLPDVYWRLINQGVPSSKSSTVQVTEQCGMVEARSEVDKALAELGGNPNGYRKSEAMAFLEAMSQNMATTLFYGNSSIDPEKFTGLSPRYSSTTAANGANILLGGGSGSDNTSVWLVGWSPRTCYGIVPKGGKAGIEHEDLGLGDAFDSDNNRFRAYMEWWKWTAGLALKDWRYVVRIPNIDVSNLVADSSAADLLTLMSNAQEALPSTGGIRTAFYMNRTVKSVLRNQARAAVSSGGGLTFENVAGKSVMSFASIPVRTCDAILNSEELVA